MELNINPEQINKMVSDAVLNSAVGDALRKSIDEELKNLTAYNSPLKKAVERQILDTVTNLLVTEYGEQLKEMVKEALSQKVTSDFISGVIDAGLRRM